MKRVFAVIAVIITVCPITAFGVTGVGVGGKVGYTEYTGDVVQGAASEVGSGMFYGAVLNIATLPVIDFELHANYFVKEFELAYQVAGQDVSTAFDFQDLHVLVLAKKNLITLPASPVKLFIGGGLGWHLMNTEVAQAVATGTVDPSDADNPLALFENTSRMSGEGLAAVQLSFPMFPLSLYGEGRYGIIFGEEQIRTTQVEAGILLSF